MTDRRTPVVMCIDLEPHDRQVGRGQRDWLGVEDTVSAVEQWRSDLGDATGTPARFSWFWRADPQIADAYGDPAWGMHRYRDVLLATSGRGDAHGVHPHTWRRLPGREAWVQDAADPQWVQACVDVSIATFREVTGDRCAVTRLGDRALDWVAYRRLRAHGVLVDLSVEPGEPPFQQESTAPSPDFTDAPMRPYRPQRGDVARARRRGHGTVLMPLSATPAGSADPAAVRVRTVYPWVADAPARVERMLDERPPYLAFAVRSDITVTPELSSHFDAFRAVLLAHAGSLTFVTPLEALAALGVHP